MSDQINRDLGRLEGKVDRVERELDSMRRMVTEMHTTITEARGSWKSLLAVAGFTSTVTAAVVGGLFKLLQYLRLNE